MKLSTPTRVALRASGARPAAARGGDDLAGHVDVGPARPTT